LEPDHPPQDGEADLRLSVAALLIHAANIDGSVDATELAARDRLLHEKFGLDDGQIADLVAEASAADAEAVDLYKFTRTIKDAYDRDTRGHVMEMLWELVLADGVIDDQEAHMVWRVSGLLGFTTRENTDFRRAAQDRL
jgi:uncharacterized tellurite resistance protein B-like protein